MKRIREQVQSKVASVSNRHDRLLIQLRETFPDLSDEHLNHMATAVILLAMTPSATVRQVSLDVIVLGVQAVDALDRPQ